MDTVEDKSYKNETLLFKTILFVSGLIGFILTCSEVDSYSKFKEFYSEAYDLDLSKIVKNNWVQYTYKAIMIFVILVRKYTWYLYIIIYFLLLCAIVLNSKKFFALWLYLSAIRSLSINIIVVLTGLWLGFITDCNKWTLLDFFLFKLIEIGFSTAFWCVLRTVYRTPDVPAVTSGRQSSRKRRASFHEFYRRGAVSLNAVRRSASLHSVVNRKKAIERLNSVGEDDPSSLSYDSAARVKEFLKLSPGELEHLSKLKSTKILENRYWRDMVLRFQRLPIDTMDIVDIDLLNEKSEIKTNEVDMLESRKEFPLTLETLLSIFYKYHYYKPIIKTKESKYELPDKIIDSTEI